MSRPVFSLVYKYKNQTIPCGGIWLNGEDETLSALVNFESLPEEKYKLLITAIPNVDNQKGLTVLANLKYKINNLDNIKFSKNPHKKLLYFCLMLKDNIWIKAGSLWEIYQNNILEFQLQRNLVEGNPKLQRFLFMPNITRLPKRHEGEVRL